MSTKLIYLVGNIAPTIILNKNYFVCYLFAKNNHNQCKMNLQSFDNSGIIQQNTDLVEIDTHNGI